MASIQNLSSILRWLVWLFPIGIGSLLLTGGQGPVTVIIDNDILASVWQSGLGADNGLIGFMVLRVTLLLTTVFWISRLFKTFSRGIFFGTPAIGCFVWLAWLYFTGFLLEQALSIYAHYDLGSESLSFDIGVDQVCTMALLLIIVHILRAASRVQQENESFV
jgi:hypothetical protein